MRVLCVTGSDHSSWYDHETFHRVCFSITKWKKKIKKHAVVTVWRELVHEVVKPFRLLNQGDVFNCSLCEAV